MSATVHVRDAPPLNVANAVTVARIAAVVPLVAFMMATPQGSNAAAVLFIALAASDALDGWLARSRGLVTTLGKLLDPVADKLLIGGALLALVETDRLSVAVAVIILGREALVSALRWVAFRRGRVVAANDLGKVKMCLQVAMVLALTAVGYSEALWVDGLVITTVVVTIVSGLSYLSAIVTVPTSRRTGDRAPRPRRRHDKVTGTDSP